MSAAAVRHVIGQLGIAQKLAGLSRIAVAVAEQAGRTRFLLALDSGQRGPYIELLFQNSSERNSVEFGLLRPRRAFPCLASSFNLCRTSLSLILNVCEVVIDLSPEISF